MSELKEKFEAQPEVKAKKVKKDKKEVQNKKNLLIKSMEWLDNKYSFRYNVFTQKPEYCGKGASGYISFDERGFDNIFNEITIDGGLDIPINRLASLIGCNKLSADYDPIMEYINKLPKWDGVDRFPLFLQQVQLIDEEINRPLLNTYFKKWFITMVGSIVNEKTVNETAIVFTGKQARGKTRFFNSLLPEELRQNYAFTGNYNPKDKDHEEMLGTKILINLDEMATLNRTEIEVLKTTMSKRYIVLRRAYGRSQINLVRKASFCGSINEDIFLTDTTGNRRWLPFPIENIDVDETFDIKLLYAQALEEYREGFNIWYSRSEIEDLDVHNEQFRRVSQEEEILLYCFAKPSPEDKGKEYVKYWSTSQIVHHIASKEEYRKMNVNDTVIKRMGHALKKLKFNKVKKRVSGCDYPIQVYEVMERINKSEFNSAVSEDGSNNALDF